jgi:hypothetical protein
MAIRTNLGVQDRGNEVAIAGIEYLDMLQQFLIPQ